MKRTVGKRTRRATPTQKRVKATATRRATTRATMSEVIRTVSVKRMKRKSGGPVRTTLVRRNA